MAPPARAEAIPPAIAPNIITSLKWLETNNLFNNLIQRNQSAAFSSGKVRPNHETNINIIARRTGKDVNSHTVLDGIITTIMATIQRINIIGSREGSRNRRDSKRTKQAKNLGSASKAISRYKLITNVRSSLMAVNIHITIIELNALHTKRQNLFQELDAVIHLLMEAKHWGLRKSRNATSLNSRFKSLDTLKVKIISVTFRRVIRTNHKKASKIWRHENIQLGGCQS